MLLFVAPRLHPVLHRPTSPPRYDVRAAVSGRETDLATLDSVADLIATSENVIVMAGAGISVSAGIPDFRTPGTGLYDNLVEYGLPRPEAIFELPYFVSNPRPFYRLCRELWPGNFEPTPTHYLLRLLHEKGKLLRCFTQNIDSLESAAGLPVDAIVAAHGNFDSAHVIGGPEVPLAEVKAAAFEGEAAWELLTAKYGGLVKPDIVFFGEQLPPRFFRQLQTDLPRCDLLIVMGTSLAVQPFASRARPPLRTRADQEGLETPRASAHSCFAAHSCFELATHA